MDVLPVVNELVMLRDRDDREYQSRVEDLRPGLMIVAQPLDLAVDHTLDAGSDLLVMWHCPRGIAVLPVRITATYAEGALRLWSTTITGPGWVEQRRRFVRIPASGPVQLVPHGGEHGLEAVPDPVPAKLIEISEGALRCTVTDAAFESLAEAGPVQAGFCFGDVDFSIPGHINIRRPGPHDDDPMQVVVEFDEPVKDADTLRKLIFAQQQRAVRRR